MEDSVVQRLLDLNRRFYEEFAAPFAESRGPDQEGVRLALDFLPVSGPVLDVGCGNGRLAQAFEDAGRPITYLGIDSSTGLLDIARRRAESWRLVRASFLEVDVTKEGWSTALPSARFDAIVALAVLHHLPGWRLRLAVLAALRTLLDTRGVLLVSAWQFRSEERFQRKIVPWSAIGLTEAQVEPGDALLDWQRGGSGLRYCHPMGRAELIALAHASGMAVADLYYADGRTQTLNLFGVLRPGG